MLNLLPACDYVVLTRMFFAVNHVRSRDLLGGGRPLPYCDGPLAQLAVSCLLSCAPWFKFWEQWRSDAAESKSADERDQAIKSSAQLPQAFHIQFVMCILIFDYQRTSTTTKVTHTTTLHTTFRVVVCLTSWNFRFCGPMIEFNDVSGQPIVWPKRGAQIIISPWTTDQEPGRKCHLSVQSVCLWECCQEVIVNLERWAEYLTVCFGNMILDASNSRQAWPRIRLITFMRPISSDAAALKDAPNAKRTLSTLSDESGAHHTLTRKSLPQTACEIHCGYWCLLDSNNNNVLWEASAETAFLAEWCARCWAPLDSVTLTSHCFQEIFFWPLRLPSV